MTDINASLKKTIDGEPGPQYKEKNKAEFNFAEGEDGVPYSYDKKVESRLTAIEDKLDSVIENGSVNTQLTGSIVELKSSLIDETITAGSRVDLYYPSSSNPTQHKKIFIIIRLSSRADYDIEIMNLIRGSITGYNSIYNVTNSLLEAVEHEMMSNLIRIRFFNKGDEDISLYGYKIVGVN